MAKTKTRTITIREENGTFYSLFKRFSGEKHEFDFSGISTLRKILSNERARLLHVIKEMKPESIYGLAKLLKRDFKSVREDVRLMEKFGFIDLVGDKKGARERLRPEIIVDTINIVVSI